MDDWQLVSDNLSHSVIIPLCQLTVYSAAHSNTVNQNCDDTWQRHMREDSILFVWVKRSELSLSVMHTGENACLVILLGLFNSQYQLISGSFFVILDIFIRHSFTLKGCCHMFFLPKSTLQLKMIAAMWRMCKNSFEVHKQQATKVHFIDHRRHPGSQLCVELFSNSCHWSL